ncbi:MAG: ABC transporter permease subunit [Deferribacterales bacterium]
MKGYIINKKQVIWDGIIGFFLITILFLFISFIFEKLDYRFEWGGLKEYFFYYDNGIKSGLILNGIFFTLKLSLFIIMTSTFLAIIFAIIRFLSPNFLGFPIYLITETLRTIPPLVVMYMFYFFIGDRLIPDVLLTFIEGNNIVNFLVEFFVSDLSIFKQFFAASIGLAFYEASYISEIIRGGLNGISKTQVEAGLSLGLNRYHVFTKIILPQALEKSFPAMAGQYVSIIKNTSIASVVAIPELTFVSMEVLATNRLTFEIWLIIILIYLIINIILSMGIKMLDIKIKLKYF